jgi:hypothetical protein
MATIIKLGRAPSPYNYSNNTDMYGTPTFLQPTQNTNLEPYYQQVYYPTMELPSTPYAGGQPLTQILQTITHQANTASDVNCNCLAGTPYIENGVCKCTQPTDATEPTPTIKPPNTTPIYTTTNAPIPQPLPVNASNVVQKLKDNPLLVVGGIVALVLVFKK